MSVTSRKYLKRVWRVPKHRGASEYLATLCVKMLRKHGWPAVWRPIRPDPERGFLLEHKDYPGEFLPPDMLEAVETAVRIVSRMYRVDVTYSEPFVEFNRRYAVTERGTFKEV